MSELRKYLISVKRIMTQSKAREFYVWVLKEGELFTVRIDTKDIRKRFRVQKKGCFYNAQMLMIESNFDYYEGWAISSRIGIPIEHGFNVKNGKVIDVSWDDIDINNDNDNVEYFGVKIPKKFVTKEMFNTKMAESILYRYFREMIDKGG